MSIKFYDLFLISIILLTYTNVLGYVRYNCKKENSDHHIICWKEEGKEDRKGGREEGRRAVGRTISNLQSGKAASTTLH